MIGLVVEQLLTLLDAVQDQPRRHHAPLHPQGQRIAEELIAHNARTRASRPKADLVIVQRVVLDLDFSRLHAVNPDPTGKRIARHLAAGPSPQDQVGLLGRGRAVGVETAVEQRQKPAFAPEASAAIVVQLGLVYPRQGRTGDPNAHSSRFLDMHAI